MNTTKRLSFDREDIHTLTDATEEIFRDKERIEEGWERVYVSSSIRNENSACTGFRFGTGGEDKPKWHNQQVDPAADVVYCTCWEYHCRRHDRALWAVIGGFPGNVIHIVWHGFDKLIRER